MNQQAGSLRMLSYAILEPLSYGTIELLNHEILVGYPSVLEQAESAFLKALSAVVM